MARIPTKDEILAWISDHPTQGSKRDIARAFGIKGADRVPLKAVLRELEDEGHLAKRGRSYRDPERLPPVSVLEVLPPDGDGDLFARPLEWHGEGPAPRVAIVPRAGEPALGGGDRILARLTHVGAADRGYEARLIRRIAATPRRILGIFRKGDEGGRLLPVDKKADREWRVAPGMTHGARDGELVEAETAGPRARLGLPQARIVARLGDPTAPRAVSLIAIHEHGIPDRFPDAVLQEAERARPAGLSGREDLRDLPLVTIDPEDARDHDDAVYAHPDEAPDNDGGHVIWVAIADVAHYVRPGTALDREARMRGNSTYFPDRVVPMLPDRLSGDLCSLHEGVPRPCIAVRMRIAPDGELIDHRFVRGMMRSAASLTYGAVQAAIDGAGRVTSVDFRERLDAHRLIEECMILANVAAAQSLAKARSPLLYRVHEEPSPEKIEALRETAQASGLTLAKGQVLQTRHLNRLLAQAAGTDDADLINLATLRSMTQAYYSPENFAHFGLALRQYAHFTSPIRRYADLVVHRALIAAHDWDAPGKGGDGLTADDIERLEETAKHISDTERRSMMAERDTTDRYLAAYLAERVGTEMTGRISGVTRFGLFVKLDGSGADGLVPIRSIGAEFYHFDAESQTLMGADSGFVMRLGQPVAVRLREAEPVTGGIALELLEVDGKALPRQASGRRGAGPRRKPARAHAKAAAGKRKVRRTRP